MKRLFFVLTALLIFLFSEVNYMDLHSEVVKGSEATQRYVLDNGMTVILEKNSSSPVTAVNVWVGTGSACEIEGEFGLAHVHEHMLFKGTKRRKVGEIARLVEAGGGDINAFTSFDETVYYVVSASRFLDDTLDILSDVVENSTFDPDELKKELEVVVEEIRRGQDSPNRVLSQKLFATAYDVHPYRRPIIGTKESVRSFTREGILEFYEKWYSPQNMILVVVGDFEEGKIQQTIENTFGKIKKRDIPTCDLPQEPKQEKLKTFVIDKDINEGYLSMAYHVPSAKHPDTPIIDVLSNILGSGESSRLFRSIKEDKGLVNNIYSYAYTPKDDGLFFVGGTLETENIKHAYKEIINEVETLKVKPVSQEELSRAIVNIESSAIYTKETMQGQAQKLGYFELEAGDYKYENEYLERVKNVTPDDIMEMANKYFTKTNLTAGLLLPSNEKNISESDLASVINSAYDNFKVEKTVKPETNQDVKEFTLENGIKLLVKENKSVPLFAIRAAFLGGSRYEDNDNNGISNFISEMLTRGTTTRSSLDIAREVESLAGSVDGFSGRNSIGLTADGLSRNFEKTFDIFADVLLNPAFDSEEIERARREILSDITQQKDNLLRKTVNIFLENLFLTHPYRFNTMGTEENVNKFDKKLLQDFYNKLITPENMVITVVGDVNSEQVVSLVEKKFGSFSRSDFQKIKLDKEPVTKTKREKIHLEQDKAQTHIIIGYQAPDMYDEDQYAFDVMNTILSGQGGRLFLELRDKRSLAYTVTSFNNPGMESGYFGVYIGTSPDKEQEAVSGIKEQLKLLLEKGVTDQELDRARNYIVGNFEVGLQKNSSQAAKLTFDELYEIGWEDYKSFPQKILDVTKEDVLKVAKKYIDLDSYVIAIVKPK